MLNLDVLMCQFLQASKSESEMRDIAARICRDYLTGAWKTIPAEDLQLKRISGGLSNFLYYVRLPDQQSGSSPRPSSNCYKRPRKDSYSNMLEPKEVSLLRVGHLFLVSFFIVQSFEFACLHMSNLQSQYDDCRKEICNPDTMRVGLRATLP